MEYLREWFHKFANIGSVESGGVTRLAYSKDEDLMHNTVVEIAKGIGLKTKEDGVGNKFIYIKDYNEDYILIGSHLDSVPNGGKYDGVAGIIGGLLILKWIKENHIDIPVMLGVFRAEESSVFDVSVIGSSLATGIMNIEHLHCIKDKEDNTLYDILITKGYLNKEYIISNIKEYLEIHIEQGRVLWDNNIELGIVTGIAAPQRYKLSIVGRQDHSGATPMNIRKDALCAAAEIILALEDIGLRESKHSTVATIGICKNFPNAMNVVPGLVELGIDIRGTDTESINRVVNNFKESIQMVIEKRQLSFELIHISDSKPVILDNYIVKNMLETANKLNIEHIKMISGAGHDAMVFADIVKTGMVFIPNKEGISHNPKENIELKHLYSACILIYEYLIRFNGRSIDI